MSNPSPRYDHLVNTQWRPGVSGNPLGKPKGTKHLSTWIQELLEDESMNKYLDEPIDGPPVRAILIAMIRKAQTGDVRAFEAIAKYGFGSRIAIEQATPPRPILSGLSVVSFDKHEGTFQ